VRAFALAGACAAALSLAMPAQAEDAGPVDFNGLWVISERSAARNNDEHFEEMKPEEYLNQAGLDAIAVLRPAYDPGAQCLPSLPRHLSYPYPMEIVQTHDRMVNLFEADTVFRIVYLDGREHPDPEIDTRFMGHAVGHWQGDTLIVESANFNGKAWLDATGIPQSDQATLVERYSLLDDDTLQNIATYEDPAYLTRPIWRRYIYNRRSDWEISEYICAEGNRDNAFQPREGEPGAIQIDDVIVRDVGD
jgi:hypothetical protein